MGPLLIDIEGTALTSSDKTLLQNPLVCGVILFSRNFDEPSQLTELITEIRAVSHQRLLISVDQEGGRVQRFKNGFTLIPPAQAYAMYNDVSQAKSLAFDAGWLLAMELMAFDIDLSYAPVLDLGHDCLAIGSRSFHQDPFIALAVATGMIDGMHAAGMKTTGKHFPGHGAVIADSHKQTPVDDRNKEQIERDMQIFTDLVSSRKLDAIMPAHIVYPAFDDKPASASPYWLKTMLRSQLKFDGVIFSDDLSMEGASILGDHASRAKAALDAGCDLLLACNHRQGSLAILEQLAVLDKQRPLTSNKAQSLLKSRNVNLTELKQSIEWQRCYRNLMIVNEKWAKDNASRRS